MKFIRSYIWIVGALGAVMVVSFIAFRLVTGTFDPIWSGIGGAGAALLLLYLWLDRDDLESAVSSRGARYSSMSVLLFVVASGVVVAANMLADRYDKRWDATVNRLHTLSDQSTKVAAGLSRDVEIVGFFPALSPEGVEFEELVESFQEHSDKLSFRRVDPLKEPLAAQEFNVSNSFGTVVLAAGEDQQRLETEFDEESLTNALVRLDSGQDHILCFTEGHGEREVDDELTAPGIGVLILKLEGQNYTVKEFVPLRDQVPADCEVVVLADPQQPLLPQEIEILSRHVLSGGALVAMLEPGRSHGFAASLERFGLLVGDDLVLEQNPSYQLMGGDLSYIILTEDSFDFHPIAEGFDGLVLMRDARSVSMAPPIDGARVQLIARTTEQGWAETDLEALFATGTAQPDLNSDIVASVPLMAVVDIIDPAGIPVGVTTLEGAALEGVEVVDPDAPGDAATDATDAATDDSPAVDESWRRPGGRLVVFGDSDFVANDLMTQANNQDLFLNTIAWLVGEEDQIAIRPNEVSRATLSLTFAQGFVVWGLSVFVVPFLAVMAGVGSWRRRRQL